MSDADNNENMLPPKLNLTKKSAKPAVKAPKPAISNPANTPHTSRIKLSAKPVAKPMAKPIAKPLTPPTPALTTAGAKPATILKVASAKPALTIADAKPATVLKASDAKLATVLKAASAKPATILKAKAPIGSRTVKLQAKPKTIGTKKATAPTPTVATAESPAKPTPLKPAGTTLKAKPVTMKAKPITLKAKPAGIKPKTVCLKPKPAMGIKRNGLDPDAPIGSKRSTSKIPLTSATVDALGESVNTKTINIKPSVDVNQLTGKTPTLVIPKINAKKPDPKRQTSRISLEAALGSDQESTGPKTIRLKRPTKTPTIKVNDKSNSVEELSKTSKIEMPLDEEVPATQKKTIKIKRPSQKRSAKTVSVKRNDATETSGEDITDSPLQPLQPLAKKQAPDSAHWTFIVSSIAATIIACVLIYVLCAQVFGPNISLTKLAYAAPDAELPWPGRILK